MKNTKRSLTKQFTFFSILMVLVFLLFVFAGCNSENQPQHENESPEDIANVEQQTQGDDSSTDLRAERVFYQYELIKAEWIEDESEFPTDFVNTAKAAVSEELELPIEQCSFTRGWLHDFGGDGAVEAIVLVKGSKDESQIPWDGDSSFVYVNHYGIAQYLMSGCDQNEADWRKMDGWIIQYPEFEHLMLHTGNETMAAGSWTVIYTVEHSQLVHRLSSNWFTQTPDRYFIESSGVQSQGPAFHFWDSAYNRYSSIGPKEITLDDFLQVFQPENIVYDIKDNLGLPERMAEFHLEPENLTQEMVQSIYVYGNRYYHILFSEQIEEETGSVSMTWMRKPDQSWVLFYGPSPGHANSVHFGLLDNGIAVDDVDMAYVESGSTQTFE